MAAKAAIMEAAAASVKYRRASAHSGENNVKRSVKRRNQRNSSNSVAANGGVRGILRGG